MKPGTRLTAALLLAALATPGCRTEADPYTHLQGEAFATQYRIAYLGGPDAEVVWPVVRKELTRIDWMASTWKPESELMRYNRAGDKDAFELSADLAGLLQRSDEIEKLTGGAFSIRFNPQQLDLSAIAKGHAVDRICEILTQQFGIRSCLVDIGGEIKVHGKGPRADHWKIGLYIPKAPGAPAIEPPKLKLRDTSIATSGTYFKGPHLIDPRSGRPVDHALVSASVIHPSNATADALATALYVMGADEGMAWAREHGVRAIFLSSDGTITEHRPE